LEKEQLSKLI